MIVNLQRKIKIDAAAIRAFVATLYTNVHEANGKTFSVAFVSDRRMTDLNKFFRGKDATTDVLSFRHEPDEFNSSLPSEEGEDGEADGVFLSDPLVTRHSSLVTFLGDIVISTEQAQKQAAENGLDLNTEIKQLILHGLLHLYGYDHEADDGEMDARELELREKLGL